MKFNYLLFVKSDCVLYVFDEHKSIKFHLVFYVVVQAACCVVASVKIAIMRYEARNICFQRIYMCMFVLKKMYILSVCLTCDAKTVS